MKQWMKKRKSRGFTLVELLIVIVIIGILAGSLLLVMGSGTDKANATKVVSDMRTLKAAQLMYYADNDAWTDTLASLDTYLDRTPAAAGLGTYSVTGDTDTATVVFTRTSTADGFITRLDQLASTAGIEKSGDTIYVMTVAR